MVALTRRRSCGTLQAAMSAPGDNPSNRFGPERSTLFILAAAILGAALVLAREFSYGLGLGPDSVVYVEVARNLVDGEFFTQSHGEPLILQPPLYPSILAAASLAIFDPKEVMEPVNIVVFGAVAFVAGRWIAKRIESRVLAGLGVLAVASAHPLAWAASIGFPLILLLLFTMLALINADNYFREGRRPFLAWALVFSALASLTHYTGIAVVVSVAALLAVHPGATLPARAMRAASSLLAASVPLGAWWIIVVYRTREFAPLERNIDYSFLGLTLDIATSASKWAFVNLFVDSLHGDLEQWPIASALAAAALSALALGIGYGVVRASFRGSAGLALWERWGSLFVFGGFALTFLSLYFVALLTGQTWDGAQDRHLIPAYLTLFIAAIFALDRLISHWHSEERLSSIGGLPVRRASLIVGTAFGLWLALALALHLVAIREANVYGITKWDIGVYGSPRWVNSETVAYVREQPPQGVVYSNHAEALTLYAPGPPTPRSLPNATPIEWVALAPDGAALAWFHDVGWNSNYDAADLRVTPGLEAIVELADGAVFIVNKAHNPRPARQAAYDALAAREPAVRSVYDLYLDGRTLAYVKSPCAREETAARFFLHVVPVDRSDLPEDRKRWTFDNLDFSFERDGIRLDDVCMTSARLPAYPIAEIETGQFAGGERLWDGEIRFPQ